MTATTTSARGVVSFGGVLRSEWIKFRTLRSTWWLAAWAVAAGMLVTAFWTVATPDATPDSVFEAVGTGYTPTEILLILLGVMIATADYENHAISVTFSAVPRRTPVVLAKFLLSALVGFVVGAVAVVLSFLLANALHAEAASLGDPVVLRDIGGIALYAACSAVIATAIGLVFRSTIASVGATLGFLYLLPVIISLVPGDVFLLISDTLPAYAVTNFFGLTLDSARLDPLSGAIAAVIWTLFVSGFALLWVKRRNV